MGVWVIYIRQINACMKLEMCLIFYITFFYFFRYLASSSVCGVMRALATVSRPLPGFCPRFFFPFTLGKYSKSKSISTHKSVDRHQKLRTKNLGEMPLHLHTARHRQNATSIISICLHAYLVRLCRKCILHFTTIFHHRSRCWPPSSTRIPTPKTGKREKQSQQ